MYPVYRLHSFVETAADNFQLVFAAQFHEVYGISGNADGKLRIFLRMFHGVFQHFTVQYVHVEMVCTFGEVTVHHGNQILYAFLGSGTQ